MDKDLQNARSLLGAEDYTCVLCKAEVIHTSRLRGVAPLLQLLDQGVDVAGFSAADKVVGKATALLYCLLGVKAVYAPVISRAAVDVLTWGGIRLHYDTLAEEILNRSHTGACPMETATRDIQTPQQALPAIRETVKRLQQNR